MLVFGISGGEVVVLVLEFELWGRVLSEFLKEFDVCLGQLF